MNKPRMSEDICFLKRENNPRRQSAVTFSCLGKLRSADASLLSQWKIRLGDMIRQAMNGNGVPRFPLVIGLAESGIIPSALFHQILREQGIHAEWICSTRRPANGIHFKESHSHGPDHILPLPCRQPEELWFVEDEITTGKTVLRLALSLCEVLNVRRARFFAIADTRCSEDANRFEMLLNDHGIGHSVHTLLRFGKETSSLPPSKGDFEESLLEGGAGGCAGKSEIRISESETKTSSLPPSKGESEETSSLSPSKEDLKGSEANWHFPEQRPALRNQLDVSLSVSKRFPIRKTETGTLLVVGEAIDIALKIIQEYPSLSFRHVTLSPWQMDGKHIFKRLDICGTYYLYNHHHLKSPLYVFSDPIDTHIGTEVAKLMIRKGFVVKGVF